MTRHILGNECKKCVSPQNVSCHMSHILGNECKITLPQNVASKCVLSYVSLKMCLVICLCEGETNARVLFQDGGIMVCALRRET